MIELYKDGDCMAMLTDAPDADAFIEEFAELLSTMIEAGDFDGDWQFQLERWFGQMSEILCSLKGHESPVIKNTIRISGGAIYCRDLIASIGHHSTSRPKHPNDQERNT